MTIQRSVCNFCHVRCPTLVEVEGDRARGSWDILSPCTTGEGRAMWMAGVETDEYARVNGVWLHTHMKLDVVFMAPHDKGWAKRRDG